MTDKTYAALRNRRLMRATQGLTLAAVRHGRAVTLARATRTSAPAASTVAEECADLAWWWVEAWTTVVHMYAWND